MKESWSGPLEKVDEYRWRIPKDYMPGMRVPGIIYSNERMIGAVKNDKAPLQVANAAHLPGIVRYSLAMPDIHWGYGLPIGGVVATDPAEGGVISPGGVGYDINCLSGNSLILHELGYKVSIKDFRENFTHQRIKCFDFNKDSLTKTDIIGFLKQKPIGKKVYKIIMKSGRDIIASGDHPFYTKDGMKRLSELSVNTQIAAFPFEGIDYEKPSEEIIIDEPDIMNILLKFGKDSSGHGIEQIILYLRRRNMLPLKYSSLQLPHILKVMGFVFGDGTMRFGGKEKKGQCWFYGQEDDLEDIREDVYKIGFTPSKVYSRKRKHEIKTQYGIQRFERTEFSFKVASSAFVALLASLGTPLGNKTYNAYRMPEWLFKAPLWQKRLFLASFFGAELASPGTMTGHGYNFYCPMLSMNKNEKLYDSAKRFLQDISSLLSEFGVTTLKISHRKEFVNKKGEASIRLRLSLSGQFESLLNLYGRISFEYNRKRRYLAALACEYLKFKQNHITNRQEAAYEAIYMREVMGCGVGEIDGYLKEMKVGTRYIERSIFDGRKTSPRVGENFPTFKEFIKERTEGLGESGMIWDEIFFIEENVDYDDWVYDFTVSHPHHNFIANEFVVSNCGVRLVRTDISKDDVTKRIKDLVCALYTNVPSGVGSRGQIKVSAREERDILINGSAWAVKNGYGIKEDLEATEERGWLKDADPSAVSDRAYERGKEQSGTLGSGNHFLEIQIVDEVYDLKAAAAFGVHKDQITIMIHSGSRGFGHQVCDDYAKSFIRLLDKYKISIPDKQLACAPVDSKEGKAYLGAMRCAANYAWNNRQCLMYLTRSIFEKFFGRSFRDMGMYLVYDVAHNIAKMESFRIDGKDKVLCVHRKGATRAFGPGNAELPARYRDTGQPVVIPGDMGRYSFLLAGTKKAEEETFSSTAHGAGRCLSRSASINACRGRRIDKELAEKGIVVMSKGRETLAEEQPHAYKDVSEVVDVVHNAGISKKVCRMRPIGVMKG